MVFYINYIASLLHFVLCYALYMTMLVTNDIKYLVYCLIILVYIKILFNIYDRCILSVVEENDNYSSIVSLFRAAIIPTAYDKISYKDSELMVINLGVLLVLNKIVFLLCIPYFKKFYKYIV
jgi:hypothetical protein